MKWIYSRNQARKKLRFFLSDNHRGTLEFVPGGFPSYLNKHNYAEIHMLSGGNAVFHVNGDTYTLSAGDAILIPAGYFHVFQIDDRRFHDAFQVDMAADAVRVKHFPPELIQALFREWESNENVINYLTFLCNELTGRYDFDREENRDEAYIISDFIEKNYHRSICLEELAQALHLSKMQTQRLVKKHTGKTFGRLLREYRVMIAEYLARDGEMTREQIASYVGYGSYNGFWKACAKERDCEKSP